MPRTSRMLGENFSNSSEVVCWCAWGGKLHNYICINIDVDSPCVVAIGDGVLDDVHSHRRGQTAQHIQLSISPVLPLCVLAQAWNFPTPHGGTKGI